MLRTITLLAFLLASVSFAFENKPVKVGVIDTGLDLNDPRFTKHLCKYGHIDFTGEGIKDSNSHGTHVAGLIVNNAKNANYCLVIIKFFSEKLSGPENLRRLILSLKEAKLQKIKIVNLSGGGYIFEELEYNALKENPSSLFFVAAGNENKNMDIPGNKYYPASYGFPNVFTVGSYSKEGVKSIFSNYGSIVKYWEIGENIKSFAPNGGEKIMSGTSMSTAIVTGKYLYDFYR